MKYLALLRGINVGGNNKLKMAELRTCLHARGLRDVKTYIQSGNVIFTTSETDKAKLAQKVEDAIDKEFSLTVPTAVISHKELRIIMDEQPKTWLQQAGWRYYYYFLKDVKDGTRVIEAIGALRPDIETFELGKGVIYQSVDMSQYGKARTSRLAGMPAYKLVTARNHNTVSKLLSIMDELDDV